MESFPIIIVGSGPAGTSTALHLHQRDATLARETLILEKARHPRVKVCAGGLIPNALTCLRELGIDLNVPHVRVTRTEVSTPSRRLELSDGELCYVIRRNEFDAALAAACRERALTIREGEDVVAVERDDRGVRVHTTRGSYHTRIIVGADGSGSIVRRRLVENRREGLARAVMCDVPLSDTNWDGFSARRYDFDFRQLAQGLPGYRWAFPCLIGGEPHVNVGIYSFENSPPCALRAPMGSPPPAKPAVPPISIRGFFNSHGLRTAAGHEHSVKPIGQRLNESLTEYLAGLTARPARRQAFPIHFYRPGSRFAAPHVLLVGDAAGVDPLMGEGISLALDYGALAATAAQRALKLGDFSGVDYQRAIDSSWLGKKLRRLYMAARLFYGPRWRLWFALAEHSSRLRTLGIRWYNGIDDWDRRSGWEAVRALLSWRSLSERAAALATGRDGAP